MSQSSTLLLSILILFCSLSAASQQTDSTGTVCIYRQEASFRGGEKGWNNYLQKNVNYTMPVQHGAPAGVYTVVVLFRIDKEGRVDSVRATTRHGYGMEEEALRVIRQSPKWEPAYQNGRVVRAYKRQMVTFTVPPTGCSDTLSRQSV